MSRCLIPNGANASRTACTMQGGAAYIAVSARSLIVCAPILTDGSAGQVQPVWREVLGDDFAFGDPDRSTSRPIRRRPSFASTPQDTYSAPLSPGAVPNAQAVAPTMP